MKICFIGPFLTPLAKELKKRRHKCFFVIDRQQNKILKKEFVTCPLISKEFWKIEENFSDLIKVFEFLKKEKPDLVIVDNLFPSGFFSWVARLAKIPVLGYCLGLDVHYAPEIGYGHKTDPRKRKLIPFALNFIDGYISSLYGIEQLYKNWNPPSKKHWIVTIPSPDPYPKKLLPKEEVKKKWRLENRFVILTLSRIHPVKIIEYLIRAMPKVLKANKDCLLIIAGQITKKYYKKRLDKEISKLRIKKNVIFTDDVRGRKKKEIYSLSDIFVIPSLHETGPMTLFEAMSYGLPVITTPVGHCRDILKHGRDVLVVPKRNTSALAKSIIILMENKKLREKFGLKGRKIAKENTWANQVNGWLKIFKEAVNLFINRHNQA